MKRKDFVLIFFIFLFLFAFTACKKLPEFVPQQKTSMPRTVTFTLKGFTSDIQALNQREPAAHLTTSIMAAQSPESSGTEQFLYLWTFNEQNSLPDIAINPDLAQITFIAVDPEPSFTGGYGFSPYPAGQSFSTRGTQSIIINMPLTDVLQITKLAFDVGSSATGPKNFRLSFSSDGGETFQSISEDNQLTKSDRNTYEFDLSTIDPVNYTENFLIKIEPFAGDRGDGSEYDENRGTFKIDNFRLSGLYNPTDTEPPQVGISKIYYYVFDANADTLVSMGNKDYNSGSIDPQLTLAIPVGTYYATFISNVSHQELALPATLHEASDLYIHNSFDNEQAAIYGNSEVTFDVKTDSTAVEAELKRYYSQIVFDFNDQVSLSDVGKLRIEQEHDDFIYTPYGPPADFPSLEPQIITWDKPFTAEAHRLSFNQFMGNVTEPKTVKYHITAYDTKGEELRSFSVSETIKNNVQLTFSGKLLALPDQSSYFGISWKTDWDDTLTTSF